MANPTKAKDPAEAALSAVEEALKLDFGGPETAAAEPAAEDFNRLKTLNFRHVLCGHGQPLLNSAKEDFNATFSRLFHC